MRHRLRLVVLPVLLFAVLIGLVACDMTAQETQDLLDLIGETLTLVAADDAGQPPMPGGIRTPMPGSGVLLPPGAESAPGTNLDPETTGAGVYWTVYFTDPVIPFDNVTTGGVDENLIWLINNAERTIDAAMFEFNLQRVADALIAAHQRGVRVRIVYDDEHTEGDPQIYQLIAAGIPATPDQRRAFMHNKFYVIDELIVWTGSTNITVNDVYRNNNNVIALVSPEVAFNYTTEFEEMFEGQFGPTSPANTPYPGVAVGGTWVETYFSPDDDVMTQLVSLVSEAQRSIRFMAFSFTHHDLGTAMMERAAAGVEVTGIFESRGANTEFSECPNLLNFGLDVRLDGNPRTFHHKVIIIDSAIVATGSFNYSLNATRSNDENLLILHNPAIASLYEAEFYRRMAEARLPQPGACLAAGD